MCDYFILMLSTLHFIHLKIYIFFDTGFLTINIIMAHHRTCAFKGAGICL